MPIDTMTFRAHVGLYYARSARLPKNKILDRESIVIVETDAAEADIRYMYAARIAR